jgi:hypothetical protein
LCVALVKPELTIDVLKKKNDINFQNMNSVIRTFKNYLDISIERDSITNTLTMAQACRHALVHSLGKVDQKFLALSEQAQPRDIKHVFRINDNLQFSATELGFVKHAMQLFVERLCDSLKKRYKVCQ